MRPANPLSRPQETRPLDEKTLPPVQRTAELVFLTDPSQIRSFVAMDCLGPRPRILCVPGPGYTIKQIATRACRLIGALHPLTGLGVPEGVAEYGFKAEFSLEAASAHQRLEARSMLSQQLLQAGYVPEVALRMIDGAAFSET